MRRVCQPSGRERLSTNEVAVFIVDDGLGEPDANGTEDGEAECDNEDEGARNRGPGGKCSA